MNKREFLKELEIALTDRLPESDIQEITSDYGDIFDNGAGNGKSEEEVAAELGSPAKIARTILGDGGAKEVLILLKQRAEGNTRISRKISMRKRLKFLIKSLSRTGK